MVIFMYKKDMVKSTRKDLNWFIKATFFYLQNVFFLIPSGVKTYYKISSTSMSKLHQNDSRILFKDG